jgi:hypothetical protein
MRWLNPVWMVALWRRLQGFVLLYPTLGMITIFLAGVAAWGAFNWSLELTNTEKFCVSCHEMKTHIFSEYKQSTHYANRTGVRASCPDCHVPRQWLHKVARKVAATNELYHWAVGSIHVIDLPLRIGPPSSFGPIGLAVGLLIVFLVGVNLVQRRRALSGKIRQANEMGR